jgi:hypothetical protein
MNAMNKIVRKMRARSADLELMRAIDGASTPSLRDELLTIAQRQQG